MAAIVTAVWMLERSADGVVIRTQQLGTTPVTVFEPASWSRSSPPRPAPVVLIAHGFAGSQQLMQPFALTLARNGFVAITFDFPGHGRNTLPMHGGLVDADESLRTLLASMREMGTFARELAAANGGSGRYAVVGHSMASDIVVRHAQASADVEATVGVSLFAPSIGPDTAADSPRNLLVVAGALEPEMMSREALRVIGRVAGANARLDTLYGRFESGTARRATLSPGVEHIAVLYSAHTLSATLEWLQRAFGLASADRPFVDARGRWLGLLLVGLVALAWPLSRLLPRVPRAAAGGLGGPAATDAPAAVASPQRVRWWSWRGQAPITLLPAVLTPLVLWKLPSDVLPILLGDYLVMHFALYGLLTLAGLWALGRRPSRLDGARAAALVVAALFATAYSLFAIGVPVDRYLFNMRPEAARVPVVAAMCAGTLIYFLADEWLTRGPSAAPGAYLASKACFLLSLVVAIALNPARLFFLAIIVPAILLLFLIYGLFSRWAFRRTADPIIGAVANALAFGCFIAVTFPLVE